MEQSKVEHARLLQQIERYAANERMLHEALEGARTDRDALRQEIVRIKQEAVKKAADVVEKTLADDFETLCKQLGVEPQAAADAPASIRIASTLKWALEKTTDGENLKVTEGMVSGFLCWRLPSTFNPDGGILFDRNGRDPQSHCWPVGTNLFSADEARQMLEHVLAVSKNCDAIKANTPGDDAIVSN